MAEGCSGNGARRPATGKRLVILGGGSAAFAAALRAEELGAEVTIVNDGLPVGGTCVNVGCVPSKTLLRAAAAHYQASRHGFAGIQGRSEVTDFAALMRQQRELVEKLRGTKYLDVIDPLASVRLIEGRGRLLGPGRVSVGSETLAADAVLIATGAGPALPEVPGLDEANPLTSESVFGLDRLPASMIVLGGRYVALETAQTFARLGSRVSVLQRSARILPGESADLTAELTACLREEGIDIHTGVELRSVHREDGSVVVQTRIGSRETSFEAETLLAATGRKPNTTDLGLDRAGIERDESGFVRVDDTLATSAPGVFAAGDVIGGDMFVYTAAYEGRLAAENALTGSGRSRQPGAVPWVVFTDPQVAGIGLDEAQARADGLEVEAATLPLTALPRAVVAHDTRGFVKLIREAGTKRLLGARILAPEGGELLMELSLAIRHRLPTTELAETLHPYLTLAEAVKLAALSFEKDPDRLSCCAA